MMQPKLGVVQLGSLSWNLRLSSGFRIQVIKIHHDDHDKDLEGCDCNEFVLGIQTVTYFMKHVFQIINKHM